MQDTAYDVVRARKNWLVKVSLSIELRKAKIDRAVEKSVIFQLIDRPNTTIGADYGEQDRKGHQA